MDKLKPCPFCGGNAKISSRQMRFIGQNYLGWKQIKFAAYGMCNRCKSKGPTVTAVIIAGNKESREAFDSLFWMAGEAWNRRADND